MTTEDDERQPSDNMELLKQQGPACGPECGCHPAGPSGRKRWILGVIVLIAAAAFVARAMMKNDEGLAAKAVSTFATVSTTEPAPVPDAVSASPSIDVPITSDATVWKEIGALADLNAIAGNKDAVFVFLPGKSETPAKAPTEQVRGAAMKLESTLGIKFGIFTLKTSSRDYEQFATAKAVPGVLAMVKGRGMNTVSGDITEWKLIQGYVAASSAAGSGGCCPSGGGGSKVCK